MKWTNRGHELDVIGERYAAVDQLFIWGAGKKGKKCIAYLRWLKIDSDFSIYYVDSDVCKQGTRYCGLPVISPEELVMRYDDSSAIVSSGGSISRTLETLHLPYFEWEVVDPLKGDRYFSHWFLCVYMLYKHKKLLVHSMDYNVTTRCNLDCKGCLNFNHYIRSPKDESFDEFKRHMNVVFSKLDYCHSFHFCGGEAFLHKDLHRMVRYMTTAYGENIYDPFIIINGTVPPSDELLSALKDGNWRLYIDDYRDTVPLARERIPRLEERLCACGIAYEIGKPLYWYDLQLGMWDSSDASEAELINRRDDCNRFLQSYSDGRIYSCCYEIYAQKAELLEHSDFLDIASASKKEILEYRLGYTEKGYVDMCTRCTGIGKDTPRIPPAVQIPKCSKRKGS